MVVVTGKDVVIVDVTKLTAVVVVGTYRMLVQNYKELQKREKASPEEMNAEREPLAWPTT